MGLQDFARFNALYRKGHDPNRMGFHATAGDITRLSYRMKLARGFRGLDVEDYSADSIEGYNAFFRVFLTHSVLEQYLEVTKHKLDDVESALAPFDPKVVIDCFFQNDPNDKLYKFLCSKLTNKRLKTNLMDCRVGKSVNVAYISASIRHIFAHGHLTANAKGINPKKIHVGCKTICDCLLNFIDHDFSKRIYEYDRQNSQPVD